MCTCVCGRLRQARFKPQVMYTRPKAIMAQAATSPRNAFEPLQLVQRNADGDADQPDDQ